MQITFDPHNAQECATIARLLGTTAAPATVEKAPPAPERTDTPTATVQPDTPVTVQLDTVQPDTPPAPEPVTAVALDCHGMAHDDAIHSSPPSKNADGSYRARRGQKEAYDAAVAAKGAKPAIPETAPDAPAIPETAPDAPAIPETAPVCVMPTPIPAAAAPATPPAPIEYKAMAERFVAKMQDPNGLPADYETIYAALSISYDDLDTNQTNIARLSAYMDAVDEGDDHDQCVRHAMSAD